MKCPICSQVMEPGYLQTGRAVAFTKYVHRISLLPKPGEVMLENNFFEGAVFDAHICKACKKIVVDYIDKKVKER